MAERFRPIVEHIREATSLTLSLFMQRYDCSVLIWPQEADWMADAPFQFETYQGEYPNGEPSYISPGTESQIAKTLVVEIRKQASPAPTNMICVGRAADNDIVLANHTISKLHSYFLASEDQELDEIVDANSTNGTMVNSTRLVAYENHPLSNGDQIQFGPTIKMLYLTPQGFYDLLQQFTLPGIN